MNCKNCGLEIYQNSGDVWLHKIGWSRKCYDYPSRSVAEPMDTSPDGFVKQGEAIIDQLDGIDNQVVEMGKSEHCIMSVWDIREMIKNLKKEIEIMTYSRSDG